RSFGLLAGRSRGLADDLGQSSARARDAPEPWHQRRHRLAGRSVVSGRILAQLQGTDVGHNRPAILGRDLSRVVRHYPESMRYDTIEVSEGCLAQPFDVIRGRFAWKAVRRDNPISIAQAGVTRCAINVEP